MPRSGSAHAGDRDQPRALFGREEDIRRLMAVLTHDRPGLVTVTGPGGVGKSALVAAVARQLDHRVLVAEQSEHGTEFVTEFLTTATGTAVPHATDGPIPRPPAGCPPRRLLVIDPADDLATAIGDLTPSLPPGSQILATSIRPLGLSGERTVPLGPLPTIDPVEDPESLAANPSVRLLRSAAAPGSSAPGPEDLGAMATVCRLLGGWPLAIERAAALTHLLPPAALADMLAEHPEVAFESVASPGNPTRLLPSLRAAFDRTWRRLTASERAMLRAASMFAGPFGVPQVAAVAATPVATAVRTLTRLLGLHLVDRAAPHGDRFTISAPVRQYTRWSFGRRAPERPPRQRYVDLVRDAARSSAQASNGGDEVAAMRAIGEVEAELVPTLDHLLAVGATGDALQLAADLAPGLVQSGEFDAVTERLDALLRRTDVAPGPAFAGALIGYADIVFTGIDGQDRHDLAGERLRRGVQMLREFSEHHALLRALSVMIRAWPVMRDPRVVAACVQEGAALAREVGAPAWLARFEAWSGMLAHQTGDLPSALTLGKSALARGRRCGDLRALLLAGLLLHTVPEPPTDIPGGLPTPEDLVQIAQDLREPRLGSIVLAYLAREALLAGQLAEASYWCARALETGGGLDTPFGAGFAIMFLAGVARARGETGRAVTLHGMVADRLDELAAELPPRVAVEYAALVDGLRTALGAADFNAQASAGAMLAWRDATAAALAYAYRTGGSDGGPPPEPGPVDPPPPVSGRPDATPAGAGGVPGPADPTPTPTRLSASLPAGPGTGALTPREQQVLDLIAEGWDTRAIADRLRVSVHAVSHHTSNVLGKLGVENRTQAAIWAVRRQHALLP